MTSVSDIRVYVGPQLPRETEKRDLEKLFEEYGELKDVQLKSGFAFVEFASSRDAENAIKDVHGKKFFGERINVEFAQVSRRYRDDGHEPYRRGPPVREPVRSNRPTRSGNRVLIDGLSTETSWQDLKDFMREAGQVCFADVPRERDGRGVIEYAQREDMLKAIETLNGKECKGQVVTITEDPNPHDEPAFTSRLSKEERYGSRPGYGRERSPPRRGGYGGGYGRDNPSYSRSDCYRPGDDGGSFRRDDRRDDRHSSRRDHEDYRRAPERSSRRRGSDDRSRSRTRRSRDDRD